MISGGGGAHGGGGVETGGRCVCRRGGPRGGCGGGAEILFPRRLDKVVPVPVDVSVVGGLGSEFGPSGRFE
jgi:hypothetical protein